jgi:hypothetical protein
MSEGLVAHLREIAAVNCTDCLQPIIEGLVLYGAYPFHARCLERVQMDSLIADYDELGTMNGWKENPPKFDECVHPHEQTNDHSRVVNGRRRTNTWQEMVCHICRFKYGIDSSG